MLNPDAFLTTLYTMIDDFCKTHSAKPTFPTNRRNPARRLPCRAVKP